MAYLPFSYKCFAYKTLKKQIGKQCDIYQRLHKTGDLGSMPDMYKESDYGITIPTESTSAFFRGGIITTMACFEEFLSSLYKEAADIIEYERKECDATCEICRQQYDSEHLRGVKRKDTNKETKDFVKQHPEFNLPTMPLLHRWWDFYAKSLCGQKTSTDFMAELIKDGPMTYFYLLEKDMVSKIEISDEVPVCALLRLFYGIRCIMGHGGNPDNVLKDPETLKDFHYCQACVDHSQETNVHSIKQHVPTNGDTSKLAEAVETCNQCQNPTTLSKLGNISHLSSYVDDCIKEQGKEKVLKSCRFYPKRKPFTKLQNPESKVYAERIIERFFSNIDKIDEQDKDDEPLDENYAFYHLCRIYSWLKGSRNQMYITYGLLVRINQFILVLAYRMRFAVANILIKRYKIQDGIWGVPEDIDERKEKIKKFEENHKKKVEKLKSSQKYQLLPMIVQKK